MAPARLAYSACSAWAATARRGRGCTSCDARWCGLAGTGCRRRSRWTRPSWAGSAGGGRRHLGKKALVVIAAEVRGRAIGRIRMQRVADASADSLLTFVQHAVQPGSVVITDGLQSYRRLPKRGYRHDRECSLVVASRPRRSCLASTGLRRSSSAGSWVRIRAASVASISTITSTSSPFGSIDEPHAIAGSSSIGSWNRPWRWVPFPTRRWSRVSVVGRRNATTTGSRDLSKGNTHKLATRFGQLPKPPDTCPNVVCFRFYRTNVRESLAITRVMRFQPTGIGPAVTGQLSGGVRDEMEIICQSHRDQRNRLR